MTYYNAVFDEKQYRSVTKKAKSYFLETAKSAAIPLIITEVPDAKEYVHVIFAEATGTSSGLEWVEAGEKMNVRHNYATYTLPTYQGLIQIRNQDIANFGESLIADKHAAEIEELVHRVDEGQFHGPINDLGLQIMHGLIGQITPLINLSSGGDEDCSGKGEIWLHIKKMIEDIPFRYRERGPDMVMYIAEKVLLEAQAPDRIYNDMVEWDFIYRQFIGPEAVHGRKIGKVIITDKILTTSADSNSTLHATDVGATSADVLGTEGRILIFVPDTRVLARVVSRGFSLIGEEQHMLSVDQLYGTRMRTIVFDGVGLNLSEQLTF